MVDVGRVNALAVFYGQALETATKDDGETAFDRDGLKTILPVFDGLETSNPSAMKLSAIANRQIVQIAGPFDTIEDKS